MQGMSMGDRLSAIAIGIGVIVAVINGNCSSSERFQDMQRAINNNSADIRAGFAAAAEQRRNEHDQIIRRLERLEDLHLKPADGQ